MQRPIPSSDHPPDFSILQIFIKYPVCALPGTKLEPGDSVVGRTQFYFQKSYKANDRNRPKWDTCLSRFLEVSTKLKLDS